MRLRAIAPLAEIDQILDPIGSRRGRRVPSGGFGSRTLDTFAFDIWFVPSTIGTKPFSFGFPRQIDARKMKPFDFAVVIIAPNHLAKRHLVA